MDIKTVCLFGPNLPPYFSELDGQSEAIENQAIDLWNSGFGVLVPHLNNPRSPGLVITERFRLSFEARAVRDFADAIFFMPGWEEDEHLWFMLWLAHACHKPVFDNLTHIVRWREGKNFSQLFLYNNDTSASAKMPFLLPVKVAFVTGKYFVGEKKNDILIPNRNAIHENIVAANNVAVKLWLMNVAAFTPHNNTHHFELKTHVGEDVYQEFDRMLLQRLVDGLVVLPSWVNSSGGKKEVAFAHELGKPVINSYDLVSVANWRDDKGQVNVITTIVNKNPCA